MPENSSIQSTLGSGFPAEHRKKYFELCKPGVVLLITFTALVGMRLSAEGPLPWSRVQGSCAMRLRVPVEKTL